MNIFDHTQIGTMTLKSRIIRTAIGDHGTDERGHLGDKDFEGYERVAKGGVSTVILVGGVRGKQAVEHILADTPIQYIGMARPFNADPDLMKKWSKEE